MLIGGPEIHVRDDHMMTVLRQDSRKVERDDALTHPAFATTDGNDARSGCLLRRDSHCPIPLYLSAAGPCHLRVESGPMGDGSNQSGCGRHG